MKKTLREIQELCYNNIMEGSVMKRCLKMLLFVCLLVIVPIHTQAKECDYTTKAKLKRMASNINTSYTPVENGNTMSFTATITNVYPGLKVRNVRTKQWYDHNSGIDTNNMIVVESLVSGISYRFDVYSENVDCGDDALASYYLTLPSYNPYYKDPLCVGIEEYQLCGKWLKHSLTHDEFVKEITKYKESLNQKDIEKKEQKEINPIIQFVKDYYYIFIGLGVFVIAYVIYIRYKKDSFGF